MHLPAGRAVGCKKVKLLEPRVRLARFHKESFPSLRGRDEVAVSSCSETTLGDLSSEDILISRKSSTIEQNSANIDAAIEALARSVNPI